MKVRKKQAFSKGRKSWVLLVCFPVPAGLAFLLERLGDLTNRSLGLLQLPFELFVEWNPTSVIPIV